MKGMLERIEEIEAEQTSSKSRLHLLKKDPVFSAINKVETHLEEVRHDLILEQIKCPHIFIETHRYCDYDRNYVMGTCAICNKEIDIRLGGSEVMIKSPKQLEDYLKMRKMIRSLVKSGMSVEHIREAVKDAFKK